VKLDPWLSPFEQVLQRRYAKAHEWIDRLNKTEGGLDVFSKVRSIAINLNVKNEGREGVLPNTCSK